MEMERKLKHIQEINIEIFKKINSVGKEEDPI